MNTTYTTPSDLHGRGTKLFSVREMTEADVRRAYALIESVRADVSFQAWRRHIATVRASNADPAVPGGAIALICPQDYVYGVFTYTMRRTLAIGCSLIVDDFCASSLGNDPVPANALLQAADELAGQHGCRSVCIHFLDSTVYEQIDLPGVASGGSYSPLAAMTKMIS